MNLISEIGRFVGDMLMILRGLVGRECFIYDDWVAFLQYYRMFILLHIKAEHLTSRDEGSARSRRQDVCIWSLDDALSRATLMISG